jgi:AP-3 complex subunit delta-1
MSLLYECIHTVIVGGMIAPEESAEGTAEDGNDTLLARLCVSKLKIFIEDRDPNCMLILTTESHGLFF